jgi:hypothetical protein
MRGSSTAGPHIHEGDVIRRNITADVCLLRARLGQFGDRVVTAEAYGTTIERIEHAIAELGEALDTLRDPRG